MEPATEKGRGYRGGGATEGEELMCDVSEDAGAIKVKADSQTKRLNDILNVSFISGGL